jgi:hypothetical protein
MIDDPSVHLDGGVAVTLKIGIQEVLGSNLGQTAVLLTEIFLEFLQFFEDNARIVPQLATAVSFEIFSINYWSVNLSLDAV